jgi:hypothetical protein
MIRINVKNLKNIADNYFETIKQECFDKIRVTKIILGIISNTKKVEELEKDKLDPRTKNSIVQRFIDDPKFKVTNKKYKVLKNPKKIKKFYSSKLSYFINFFNYIESNLEEIILALADKLKAQEDNAITGRFGIRVKRCHIYL